MTSQSGPYPQTESPEGVLNLAIGQPSPSLLPMEAIGEAAGRGLGKDRDPLLLQYGALAGYQGFRESLAGFLTARTGREVRPEELLVSAGNSMGLMIAAQSLARPGATIVCEDPTYFLAAGILRSAGYALESVPVDEGGLSVDALEERLALGKFRPEIVYAIPRYQNPTGTDLAPDRAERLVALAERYGFHVVADEPYSLLHFGPDAPPPLVAHDRGRDRVVTLGSFSKILAPGLRLGWLHASPAVLERIAAHGVLVSGGGFNPVVSAAVEPTLRDGFLAAHVDRLRETYRERAAALADALRESLPDANFDPPRGGYFLWLRLPPGVDAARLRESAEARRVRFVPGARCALERDLSSCIRLSFAFHTAGELREGARRLAAAVDDVRR